jgi:NADPH:quinone reductase-like Zn-dependent oxidoreductase
MKAAVVTTYGSMAQRVAVDLRRSVPLPQDADPVQIAATMNPAMASWVALRQRMTFRPGSRVLVLGATGNAGRAAVTVARYLGAGSVVAAGRKVERIADLARPEDSGSGVTELLELDGEPDDVAGRLAEAGKDADVVLDFLWGEPTSRALYAIIPHRVDDGQLLTWIQIGSVAGRESAIPSAALRAANLRLIGSGQGSVEPRAYREEIGELAGEIHKGTFRTAARTVALRDVEAAWVDALSERIVIVP